MVRNGLIAVAIVTLAVIALINGLDIRLDAAVGRVMHPIGHWMTSAGTRVHNSFDELDELGSLRNQLEQARIETRNLRLQLIELEWLRAQNEQLRKDLGFVRSTEYATLPADIINYQPDPSRDMLRINIGRNDGIEVDMPVVAEGALLGVVTTVQAETAEVLLLTDTEFRALATVHGEVPGVVKGQIGSGVVMEQLPHDLPVDAGDVVATSGLDGVFPSGLLIGTVRSYSRTSGSVFNTAQVSPAVSVRDIQTVLVILQ